jgi:hypothetical protein
MYILDMLAINRYTMKTRTIKLDLSNIKDFKKSETLKERMERAGWAFVKTVQTGVDTFESTYQKLA